MTRKTTLADVIHSVRAFARDDNEVVATVTYLINSGKVRFSGAYAGAKVKLPLARVMTPRTH